MVINVAWPRVETYGTQWYNQWAALLYSSVLLFAGVPMIGSLTSRRWQEHEQGKDFYSVHHRPHDNPPLTSMLLQEDEIAFEVPAQYPPLFYIPAKDHCEMIR